MSVTYLGNSFSVTTDIEKSGYSETSVFQNEPFIQSDPVYDLVPANFRTYTSGSGTAGVENKMFKCTTGTSVGGYGAVQSFRAINHKSGSSVMTRFGCLFESSVANSWQGVGLINIGDELSFGYKGTDFGVWHRYNGLAEVRTITISGAAGGAETLTLTLNSVGYAIPLTSGTTAHNAYEIAAWLNANQSIWDADQVDTTVIINARSVGAESGTYTFSSSGAATGSIAQNTAGATKTSDFVAQSSWNKNIASFLDPSKGNIYQIIYKNTGFGDISYYIDNPETSTMVLVHKIQYQNANTSISLGNPSLRVGSYCVSLRSTTDLVVRTSSQSAYLQSKVSKTRNPRAYTNSQDVTTSYTNIFTLRNRRTYNSYMNQIEIEPISLSVSSESAKNVIVEVRETSSTGVEQNFTAAGTDLISDIDTSAVTVTGGRLLLAYTLAPGQSNIVNLKDFEIRLPPSINFIIQAKVRGGAASAVSASLVWYEDL